MPLSLGALGVVYGDIGTSPLYALRETFGGHGHELEPLAANVLGVLSLAFWSLMLIISVKYVSLVLRADHDGEGGVLALTSLIAPRGEARTRSRRLLVLVGLVGAALLYGDGAITPAISVLSAVEGSTLAAPALQPFVVPAAVVILVGLFSLQSRGTVGKVFGPIMVLWFSVLGVLGLVQLVQEPSVLRALNPAYAVDYFAANGFKGFLSLGAIVLVVTGGEALYADMGHFGRRPISVGWFGAVLPALTLNYFGQGALLLRDPAAIEHPFFRLAPGWALIPLVVLATVATVIAAQALISGLYSLTMAAVQLDYAPRVKITHTSSQAFGQIYVPAVNWGLLAACVGLVVGFKSSSNLAAAYGVAVTGTMVVTTLLFAVVARERLGWPAPAVRALAAVLLVVEGAFLAANLFKVPVGGWFPLVVGVVVFTVLTTWHTGRAIVRGRIRGGEPPLKRWLRQLFADGGGPERVPGTAIYMFGDPRSTPPALARNLRHHGVLHERVVVVGVETSDRPRVPARDRAEVRHLGYGVTSVVLRYGFVQEPDVPSGLTEGDASTLGCDDPDAMFFVAYEDIHVTEMPGMAEWREHLFDVMHRNATPAVDWFSLPASRVVIVGVPVEL